jgi:CHAT domain-containing protein
MTVEQAGGRDVRDSSGDRIGPRARTVLTLIGLLALMVVITNGIPHRLFDPLKKLQPVSTRLIDARITMFDYAPFHPRRDADATQDLHAMGIAGELGLAMQKQRSVENLHRYALANLALGKISVTVELLREAIAQRPNDAALLTDLAAAELASGCPAEAAENAAHALESEPTSAAAAFNWALALEALSNRNSAIRAWEQYRTLDEASPWAEEANRHLSHLRAPRPTWANYKALLSQGADPETVQRIVSTFPQRVRTWVADELLPRWVESRRSEDLALLEAIGAARSAGGDDFLRDVAADARACTVDFVNGVYAYRDGRSANRSREMDLAGEEFDKAARLLDRAGSPLALLASIYSASNESYRGNSNAAYSRLANIDEALQPYPSIAAEAHWVRGLLQARGGEHGDALHSFRKGLDLSIRSGETENCVALTALIATELDELAEPAEADRFRAEALRRVDEIDASPQRTYVAVSETALIELQRHRPHVALSFIETQQSLAEAAHDPLLLAESATTRALALHDIGRTDAAVDSLSIARRQAAEITTDALRNRTLAEAEYVDALVRKEREPGVALISLTSAMQRWQSNGWRFHAAAARLTLGDIRLAAGDRRGAEADFRAGIADMEQERGAVDEAKLRVAYFERADGLFERLIALLIDERRLDEALSMAERKRARALLDAVERDGPLPSPLDATSIRASLPDNASLLEFELLPRGTIVWLVTRDGVSVMQSGAPSAEIAAAVEQQRNAINRNDTTAMQREGTWLFRQLIAPFAAKLTNRDTLILVPDRDLFALPFASLLDDNGKYLVESHSIAIAPSASLYARITAAGESKGGGVLAVAQPAPRDLPVLNRARSETAQLAAVYDHAVVYLGDALTPARFLRQAANAGVVSFAGHATTHALVFESRGEQPPALLTAGEVAASRFPARPLVVLAACNTGRGSVRAMEGVDSLAIAFLGAGARSVVATLWDVDDASSERLFVGFHRNIRRGLRASSALRDAQLAMLRSKSPRDREPTSWAGVVVIGSN